MPLRSRLTRGKAGCIVPIRGPYTFCGEPNHKESIHVRCIEDKAGKACYKRDKRRDKESKRRKVLLRFTRRSPNARSNSYPANIALLVSYRCWAYISLQDYFIGTPRRLCFQEKTIIEGPTQFQATSCLTCQRVENAVVRKVSRHIVKARITLSYDGSVSLLQATPQQRSRHTVPKDALERVITRYRIDSNTVCKVKVRPLGSKRDIKVPLRIMPDREEFGQVRVTY